MANGQGQTEAITDEFLQIAFPRSRPAPITSPAIRQDQQPIGSGVLNLTYLIPPFGDRDNRKFGGIV
jgi:hypothetical protein